MINNLYLFFKAPKSYIIVTSVNESIEIGKFLKEVSVDKKKIIKKWLNVEGLSAKNITAEWTK